ncbi:MAG: hypothetical protein JRN23_04395 [Nitrososphaerota archaeon]|nr:hypothetical protein [Nitrososphaerota archaeon]MDG6978635.1 hypothetical protein [Nitrososphaerota archaeon]MDG7016276.1 hypothetical protein [Nitrososphaerota archaeon]MDG7021150.1 hypothetical protein [Nitrososphaerota archaeon]MDG7022350.1 hypothetical protein [Nitrososphaerota archaeon]
MGTSSRSSTSSPPGAEDARVHSAVHLLKGAVTRVIGPRRVTFAGPGVLRVRSDAPVSTQEAGKVEAAANRKVAEDVEVLEFEMERQEAEMHFGTGIYDLAAPPEPGAHIRLVKIEGWDVSCCPCSHVETTGSVGAVRVDSVAFEERTREALFRFHLL